MKINIIMVFRQVKQSVHDMSARIIEHRALQRTYTCFHKRLKPEYAYKSAKKDRNKTIAGHLYRRQEHKRLEYVDTQEQKDRKNERCRK